MVGDLIVAGDVRRARLGGDCLGSRTGSQRDVRRAVKVDPRRNERRRIGSRLNRQIAVLAVGAFRDDAQRIRAAQRSVDRGGRLDGDVCQNGKLDTAAVIAVQRQRELDFLRIVPDRPSVVIIMLIRILGREAVRVSVHNYLFIQRPACEDTYFCRFFRNRKILACLQLRPCVIAVRVPYGTAPVCECQSSLGRRRRKRHFTGLCSRLGFLVVCTILNRDRDFAFLQPNRIQLRTAGQIIVLLRHVAVGFAFGVRGIVIDLRPVACGVSREIIGASCDNPSAA